MSKLSSEQIVESARKWLLADGFIKPGQVVDLSKETLHSLGLDSLDIVELTMAVEEDLQCLIDDDDVDQHTHQSSTLQEVLDVVLRSVTPGTH